MIFAASYERCPVYDKTIGGFKKEVVNGKVYYTQYQGQQNRCYWAEYYYKEFAGEKR